MGSLDKVFGLALIGAGLTIAIYYTLWVIHSLVSYFIFKQILILLIALRI